MTTSGASAGKAPEKSATEKSASTRTHAATPAGDPQATGGLTETERDRIKRRAHGLWREAGSPQGRDREFWEQAELQVLKGGPSA
ncbi:DUF2934 domain-containing protein [Xanthobacter sp. KR7-225]|uniref:DUF2934 domain-containing protein n=1 Tax=Xanthobacter sp. KR7-225 TaxID=3156613 RepID=UPI0032B46A51